MNQLVSAFCHKYLFFVTTFEFSLFSLTFQTFKKDVSCILTKNPNVENLDYAKKIMSVGKINGGRMDTSMASREYFSHIRKSTMSKLYEIYRDDFLIGGYDFSLDF